MPDTVSTLTSTLALAERLRDDAKKTRLAEFARLMLHTAEDLEEFVRNHEAITASHSRQRGAN
jgi:hypothetical protein